MGTISKLNEVPIANVAKIGETAIASIASLNGETPGGGALSVNWKIEAYNISGGAWNGQVTYWAIDFAGGGGNLPIVGATGTANALWPGFPCYFCGPALYEATALVWPGNGIFQGDPIFGTGPSSVGYINNAPGIGPPTDIGSCALTTNGAWTAGVTTAGCLDGTGAAIPIEIYIAGVSVYADPSPQVLIGFTQLP